MIARRWLVILFVTTFALSAWRTGWGWTAPTHRWAGNQGDVEIYTWFLTNGPLSILRGHGPFVTTYLNYPHGVNALWNTSLIFPSLLVAPITLLAGPVVSYNVLLTLATPATAAATYLLLRRWQASPPAAALGAFVFAFSPFFDAAEHGHLHLLLAALIPLIALVLDEIFHTKRRHPALAGAALGLLSLAQFFTSEELLVSAALMALLVVVITIPWWRRQVRYVLIAAGTALLVFAAVAAYPIYVQLRGPDRPLGNIQQPNTYVSDLYSSVVPVLQRLNFGVSEHFTGNRLESNGYLGLPLLLLLTIAVLVGRRHLAVRLAAIVGVVAVVLSWGPYAHLGGRDTRVPMPSWVFTRIPLLRNLVFDRFMLYAYLAAAVILAVAWIDLLRHRAVAGVLALLTVASWWPTPLSSSDVTVPRYFTTSAVLRIPAGSVAVVEPWVDRPADAVAMDWQAISGLHYRMPEGYAIVPAIHGSNGFFPYPTPLSRTLIAVERGGSYRAPPAAVLDQLRTDRVSTILVGPMPAQARVLGYWQGLLGRPGLFRGGVWAWYGV